MSEYRDAIHTAKRRIAQLEDELASLPPVRTHRAALVLIALSSIALIGGTASAVISRPVDPDQFTPPVAPVSPAVVAPPRAAVLLDVRMGRDPLVVDVNDDGTDDIVVPTWRVAEKSLYVVALDGRTFAPRWSAGPYASEWSSDAVNLALAGDLVVASDSFGGVHAFDRSTGAIRGDQKLADPVHSLCATTDGGAPKVVVGDQSTRCQQWALPYCPRSPGAFPCLSYAHVRGNGTIDPFLTYEDTDVKVTTGHAPLAAPALRERPAPYAVAVDRSSKKVLWEGKLSAAGEKVHVGTDRMTYADHHLFDIYMALGGEVRVVARDVRTGQDAWARTLPNTRDGSRLLSLVVTRGRLYATVDGALHIIDARTGTPLHVIQAIAL